MKQFKATEIHTGEQMILMELEDADGTLFWFLPDEIWGAMDRSNTYRRDE